jgi:hypothetical protein
VKSILEKVLKIRNGSEIDSTKRRTKESLSEKINLHKNAVIKNEDNADSSGKRLLHKNLESLYS